MRAPQVDAPEAPPEADAVPGAPHPREAPCLVGHAGAEAELAAAISGGQMHHAWLISGPRGIGKATLAWRAAAALRAWPEPDPDQDAMFAPAAPADLTVPEEAKARIAAGGDPGILVLRRAWDEKAGRLRAEIGVDEVRRLAGFFGASLMDGGRRVVIVDAADELTVQAQNALLKMLEEPPARAVILMIAHRPGRLLPTIRSRCRVLRLAPLTAGEIGEVLTQIGADDDPGIAALAGGSAGDALRLAAAGGGATYTALTDLLKRAPGMDRSAILRLANTLPGKGAAERAEAMFALVDTLLARLARTGATGSPPLPEATSGEAQVLAKHAPSPAEGRAWAALQGEIAPRARHGLAVNLDPAALLTDTLTAIDAEAARLAQRRSDAP